MAVGSSQIGTGELESVGALGAQIEFQSGIKFALIDAASEVDRGGAGSGLSGSQVARPRIDDVIEGFGNHWRLSENRGSVVRGEQTNVDGSPGRPGKLT